jgi:UDP-N-acetylmuramoyl-tripeptide--D-alanyl-D-alanine ligase
MIELTLAEVAGIVAGKLAGDADPLTRVTGSVEFDSRRIGPGGLFLAVPGERVDGHDFAVAAIERGAVAVLASRPIEGPSILVDDALSAIAALAREVLRRLPQVTVVGVTGSSGKTSTKDLLAQVLARLGPTIAPPGSFNNELGHPYTVLRAGLDTRYLITENSARGAGHIRYLTEIAPPRIAVVLNVGSAHLGEFGDRATIALAKGELVEALPAAADGGVAVLNGDDELVRAMATRTAAAIRLVGTSADCDVRASQVTFDDRARPSFVLETAAGAAGVTLGLSGEHHVANALAVAAVALECGLSLDAVAAALSAARPVSAWRMEVTDRSDGVVIVNDAYNANPESMAAALRALSEMGRQAGPSARTWAVLGPMAELGPAAPAAHEDIARLVATLGIDRLVVIGEAARPMVTERALEGWAAGERVNWWPDADAATQQLRAELRAGDIVLIKASRSAGLERVALALTGDVAGKEDDPV